MKAPFGIYCIALDDLKPDPVTWIREADPLFLVTMEVGDKLRTVKEASPSKKLVVMGRYYSPKWGITRYTSAAPLFPAKYDQHEKMRLRTIANPRQSALELFNDMRESVERGRGVVDFWMGANEFTCTNEIEARALCEFNIEWARLEHSIGIEVAAYAMPEGNPGDLKLWKYLIPAIRECNGKMTVHEYTAPDFESGFPWHVGRFSLMLDEFPPDLRDAVEIYVAENGFDGGIAGFNKPMMGWGGYYNHFEDYKSRILLPYANFISRFPQIKGVAQFAAHWGNAPTFDLGGEIGYKDFIKGELPEMIEPNKFATDAQRAQAVLDRDFPFPDLALGISFAENRNGNLIAVNVNSSPGRAWDKSRDRGPWGINDWFYLRKPGITLIVTDECAFDLICSTDAAFKISDGGTNFSAWTTWDSDVNNYRDQLPRARAALAQATDRVLLAGKEAIANHPPIKLPMPVFDGGWLYKQAIVAGIGCPETPEVEFMALNKPRLILECARGYAIMIVGQNETTRIIHK